MQPKQPLWIVSLVLLLLAVSAPLSPADSPEAKPGEDTLASRRFFVGIGLSTDDFSLDAAGENTNLALISSFEADLLPFLTLGARGWVEWLAIDADFDARDVTLTWFDEFGFDASALFALRRRDYVRTHEEEYEVEYYDNNGNLKFKRTERVIVRTPYHVALGLYLTYPLSFSPSSSARLTPLSEMIVGFYLEDHRVEDYDGMRLSLYFQRVSAQIAFLEAMLVGLHFQMCSRHFLLSFWGEIRPFSDPLAAIPVGMTFGIPLRWR